MKGSLFVLRDVRDFAPGAFENTAVENGTIQLGQRGGQFLTRGSYTSATYRLPAFTKLLVAWNTDTPHGTTVEMQARVAAAGKWSGWLSFGVWSPFVYRASQENQRDEVARIEWDTLVMNEQPGDTVQLRILLHTEDSAQTPHVHLLAGTVKAVDPIEEEETYAGRELYLPSYACLSRDPSISGHIASATTLTMLMNRWGEDRLPEEVARSMYDTAAGRFSNKGFLCAAGGMFGYACYTHYCGINTLRREIQHGYCVGAQVRYRAPWLGGDASPDEDLPVLDSAVSDSYGHIVAVRGFLHEDGQEYAIINDPLCQSDSWVRRKVPIELFVQMYTGLAVIMRKGPLKAGTAKPERLLTTLDVQDSEILLSAKGELLQPGQNIPGKASRVTLCYTLSDGIAYASAAQKKFYYLHLEQDGRIPFDKRDVDGRMTLYLIGSKGTTWVGEKQLTAPPRKKIPD